MDTTLILVFAIVALNSLKSFMSTCIRQEK
jgi:hypothetical protein